MLQDGITEYNGSLAEPASNFIKIAVTIFKNDTLSSSINKPFMNTKYDLNADIKMWQFKIWSKLQGSI